MDMNVSLYLYLCTLAILTSTMNESAFPRLLVRGSITSFIALSRLLLWIASVHSCLFFSLAVCLFFFFFLIDLWVFLMYYFLLFCCSMHCVFSHTSMACLFTLLTVSFIKQISLKWLSDCPLWRFNNFLSLYPINRYAGCFEFFIILNNLNNIPVRIFAHVSFST